MNKFAIFNFCVVSCAMLICIGIYIGSTKVLEKDPVAQVDGKPSFKSVTLEKSAIAPHMDFDKHNPKQLLKGLDSASIPKFNKKVRDGNFTCSTVDVVYTWVNSSDPIVIANKKKYAEATRRQVSESRIRDYGTLKYSIRSVEKYAPWVRNIVIVTSGEVPNWLETKRNPRLIHVRHDQLFDDVTNLPTFDSNAIESQFYNLPDTVAECIIYFNDDMFFKRRVYLSDYFDVVNDKQILRFGGYKAPLPPEKYSNIWHYSVSIFSNNMINRYYHPEILAKYPPGHIKVSGLYEQNPAFLEDEPALKHHYSTHNCYFFQRSHFNAASKIWRKEFDGTADNKKRTKHDVQLPFLYGNYLMHENLGIHVKDYLRINDMSYRNRRKDFYGVVKNDPEENDKVFEKIGNRRPRCVCLNDAISTIRGEKGQKQYAKTIEGIDAFFASFVPKPSSFEKDYYRWKPESDGMEKYRPMKLRDLFYPEILKGKIVNRRKAMYYFLVSVKFGSVGVGLLLVVALVWLYKRYKQGKLYWALPKKANDWV